MTVALAHLESPLRVCPPETKRWVRDRINVDVSCQVRGPFESELTETPELTFFQATFVLDLNYDPDADHELPAALRDDLAQIGYDERRVVGSARAIVADADDAEFYSSMDSLGQDEEAIAAAMLAPELTDDLNLWGEAAALTTCRVDPLWRGADIGLLGAGLFLRGLQQHSNCFWAMCLPASIEYDENTSRQQRDDAGRRLTKHWQRLGFTPVQRGFHVLDLTTLKLDKALARL